MATFGGDFHQSPAILDGLNTGAGAIPAPETSPVLSFVGQSISGANQFILPGVEPSATFGADLYQSFAYIFYNRIHIFPNPLNFGVIVTPTTRNVEVWNAFFDVSQILNSITPTALPGVSIVAAPLPRTFNPLQGFLFPVTASLDGPARVDGFYTYGFASGLNENGAVIGTRSFIVSFRHNWDSKPVERFAWKSDVHSGGSGKEQRIRLRQNPRRTVELSYLLSDARSRAIWRAQQWFGTPFQFSVPQWQDATFLTGNIGTGATSLPVETTFARDFDAAQSVMLWRDPTRFEVATVQSLSANSIALTAGALLDWRSGDYVIPIRRAVLLQNPVHDEITKGNKKALLKATIVWALIPEEFSINRVLSISLPTYRTLPVLTADSDASQDLPEEITRNRAIIDNQTGIITIIAVDDQAKPIFDYRRLLKSRQEFGEWLDFLYARAGQIAPVWIPTYAEDFELVQNILPGDVGIRVTDWDYDVYYNVAASRRDISIITVSGTMINRRINSVTNNGDGTQTLTLDATVGQSLTIAQVDRISFLRCCRLASDEVQIEYETDTVMSTTVKFQELTTTP